MSNKPLPNNGTYPAKTSGQTAAEKLIHVAPETTRPVGRPPLAGKSATAKIQIRVTMERKNAYVHAAKPRKLTAWIFAQLDKASGYEQSEKWVAGTIKTTI